MSDIAVRTVGLGKMYRIGGEREQYRTLRDTLVHAVSRPLERLRHPGAATHTSEKLWALKNVDMEVEYGEVLGIIGRNGSGKSTLLKVLSHITEPTEGRAEIRGRVASLLEVGTGFHGELTGRENIQLNGAILGMTRAEIKSRFDEIVEFAGVDRFLDTPVKRYSSGMYVRLAFAVAAHLEPEILIIDEVLAVGDDEFQKKCLGRMSDVARSGRTVLFVSHNMAAIEQLCTHALLLGAGQVLAHGAVDLVVRGYLDAMTTGDANAAGTLAKSTDGAIALEAVRVTDEDGNPLFGARCGDRMRLEIVLRSAVESPSVVVGVTVYDSRGTRVAVLNSRAMGGLTASLRTGLQAYVCQIDRMPLSPGAYRLDVKISGGGDTLVWAPHCVSLDVSDGDYHGTGRMPHQDWGGVVQLAQQWSYEDTTPPRGL